MKNENYIKMCLELAIHGSGSVSPNPMVGCVILHNDRIIGQGWHQKYGQPHAEVNAITDAQANGYNDLLHDSTLFVNLEPCSHWGKTPPCADLIISKRIPRVVVGCVDSYCEVSGRGIERMREAGVDVTVGVLEHECLHLNRRFFMAQNRSRPFVILKWAQTSDGYLDAVRPSAEIPAAWMTAPEAKVQVHRWRAEEDAIMVGTKTALLDDPSLTVREWTNGRNPLRITIDRKLLLSPTLSIFNTEAPTVLFTSENNKNEARIRFADRQNVTIDTFENITDILTTLSHEPYHVQSIIIEGGAELLNSFISVGLWDEARIFTSPLSVRELYCADKVPFQGGIPAPTLPQTAILTEESPEIGLKIFII